MKTKYLNILKIFVFIVICFVSLGYAAFGSELSISNIVADVRVKSDIRITDVSITDGKYYNLDGFNYDVDSIILGEAFWELDDYLLMNVVVTNFGNTEMGIYDLDVPNGIGYEVTGYKLKDKICDSQGNCNLGARKEITVKIFPANNGDGLYTPLKIDFDFRKMHTVSYEGITNNGYPTSVIDGGTLSFTATGSVPPKIVAFSNGDRVNYDSYSYTNNKFTYNNVTSDTVLKYKEKAYMTELSENLYFKESAYKTSIDSIRFVDYVNTSNAVKTYDLSETSGSKDIIAWITDGNDLYIGSEWGIYSKNLKTAFKEMSGVQTISFDNLNTSEATSMYYMFYGCSGLTSLDVSSFNTSKVTSMGRMFEGVSKVSTLDVSHFDTGNVTQMQGMFNMMSSLTFVDISHFNTSKVTKMSSMFSSCSSLESIDVSSFDTSNVTDMYGMFSSTTSLKTLNLSNFNTSSVEKMDGMFSGSGVENLDISSFDTGNVISMDYMFNYAKVKNLNVSNFDTSNVTSMIQMFAGVRNETLNVTNFDTSKVTNMKGMFKENYELIELDISNFDTSLVENMSAMFYGNYKLTTLKMNNATFDKVTTNAEMFTKVDDSITIKTKNATTKAWLENALGEGVGTVTIAS